MTQSILHPRTREPFAPGQRFHWTRTVRPNLGSGAAMTAYALKGPIALLPATVHSEVEVVRVDATSRVVHARVDRGPVERFGPHDFGAWQPVRR